MSRVLRSVVPCAAEDCQELVICDDNSQFDSPRHHRARLAWATRFDDADLAAEASLGLRAAKAAKAIQELFDGPPLPPTVISRLVNLLQSYTPQMCALHQGEVTR